MRIHIKTTNFELTSAVKALAQEKLFFPAEKLLETLNNKADIIFEAELAKITKHHKEGKVWRCEINLDLPGIKNILRAGALGESLEEAINLVKSKMEREIKKYKDKSVRKDREVIREIKHNL
ncbi:MAG: ribosome-associated translation inhibitor RaiA [Candidatus Niyogibacteria bacterium]|nr:ribosome-associated translation inhibitor RaiA [Candidatus Niyogibacteria bacterium]